MKKRVLSLLLVLLMVMSLVPMSALADRSNTDVAYAVEGGNIYFDKTRGIITDCDQSVTEVIIPTEIDGVAVTSIDHYAFYQCTSLASVTISNSVTSIGVDAFIDCSRLTSINVEQDNAVYSSEDGVLFNKKKTTLVLYPMGRSDALYVIPNSVTGIDEGAFRKSTSLTSVTIPNGVTSIGNAAFCVCTSLVNINIPNSVTSIGNYAFYSCTSLTDVDIPNSVTSIGYSAFEGCTSLVSIDIPNSVTRIGNYVFSRCLSMTSVDIPDSVTSIGWNAFSGCTSLASVTIPNSVTSIADYAFQLCTSLTSVTIPNSVTSISGSAFYGCTSLANVAIPNSVTSISHSVFEGCTSLANIDIPNSVTKIDISAFSGCTSLTSAIIPNIVTRIDNYVFSGCTSLASVTIPNSVTSIGHSAFNGCTSLASIDIPNSVTGIGNSAFSDCMSLENVDLKSCRYIGESAFQGCTSLKNVTLSVNLSSIGDFLFEDCWSLETIDIPNKVSSIGNSAFSNCTALSTVYLPKSILTIGNAAFRYCDNITDVYYAGSEAEWNEIDFTFYNESLTNATIHYGGTAHTHSYTAAVTAPTCTERGYTTYTCSVCGDSYKGSYVDPLGHDYKNGTCTRCGVKDPNYKPQADFTDVAPGSYCYDAVQWAVANGITKGTDKTHFSPNAGCTRGQVVTFLWRAAGEPVVSGNVGFVDVAPGSYCYEAVKWAVANGITKGTDATHLSPNATCTRGQVVTFMYRAEGEPAVGGSNGFVDVAVSSYCYEAIKWAVANGITKGTDATHFSPNATCTRGQVVTFLYRAQ